MTAQQRKTPVKTPREKFATQVDPNVLAELRALADAEGRQLQALVEEALVDVIAKKKGARPRPDVMALYEASHGRYAPLYEKLAK